MKDVGNRKKGEKPVLSEVKAESKEIWSLILYLIESGLSGHNNRLFRFTHSGQND
ncbi:hypothetical protein GFO_2380 [Christiangramia forsetii KT0803]|uniref:Uncharacterized protein n=1 Tax=Christiangramia forsetii (strain DSM 17595 / CGMCC 1.15422 / KT0803) TaxID=411154 RepID=A0M3Z7_CHRFK|nr:hypothetical protein GFO_2380 [Christiangramia forsetii KT0803]